MVLEVHEFGVQRKITVPKTAVVALAVTLALSFPGSVRVQARCW